MNLSFSTRGWRNDPWEMQVSDAVEYGFNGIEVYNLQDNEYLTDRSGPFHYYRQQETLRNLRNESLSIPCLDTSVDLSSGLFSPDKVFFLMSAAENMHVPYISLQAQCDDEDRIRTNLDILLPQAVLHKVCLLIKTCGIYADTSRLRSLMDEYASDELGALWDMHHPFRDHQESPDTTIRNLGAYVKHVHLRDSGEDGTYNIIGEGTLPVASLMKALASID